MIVVSNTTPIITLASIGRIDILKYFFDAVYIPQAVHDEIKAKRAYGHREIDDVFFRVMGIRDIFAQDILLNDLDLGEAQAIVLAKELQADIVLIDEAIGYRLARSQHLDVRRTLSLVIAAKKNGYLEAVKPLLDEMMYRKRWISQRVYRDVLALCSEQDI